MKVWQIIGMIEADGWELARTRGSHRQYTHPGKAGRVTVAGRRFAPEDGCEHPATGRIEAVNSYSEQAERYVILIEGGPPQNYSAWSPDLPGCVATGATIEECEAEMMGAIAFHLEGLAEDGGPIPEGSGPGVYVERSPRPAA